MEEIWKDIPSYEGYYQVSNLGNFRSLLRVVKYKQTGTRNYPAKMLLTETTKDNYQRIVLMKEGTRARYQAHRLVALAFIPNPENKPFINHIDGNKSNNNVTNLEWCTASENMTHADNTGLRDMFSHHNPSNAKRVKCIETGQVFLSCLRAVRSLKRTDNSVSTLTRSIARGGKAFGYYWQFIE